jgi:hypothetical protein
MLILKTRVEYGFLSYPPVGGTVNSMEQKTRVFRQIYVQEFHLSIRNVLIRIRIRGSTEVLFLFT